MEHAIYLIDLSATAVFAISGALAAGKKHMDLFGVIVLAVVTAIGGGTLRDVLLGATPVAWVLDNNYLITAILAGIITMLLAKYLSSPGTWFVLADAFGLALFAVLGAQKAATLGAGPIIMITMGIMTGVFGGVIRDIMSGELPLIFHKEIYATAAFAGAGSYTLCTQLGLDHRLAMAAGLLAGLGLRLAAVRWHLSLPVFRLD